MSGHAVSILLVEDDDLDIESFRRALRRHDVDVHLLLARDGGEALEVLHRVSPAGGVSETVVVLDLNMPGMNGHEFLEELREDARIRNSIVFVLTSSDHERDVRKAYDQNVAGYFVKSEIDSFISMIANYVSCVRHPPLSV